MYRVIVSAVLCLTLPACSLGMSQPLNFGFGGQPSGTSTIGSTERPSAQLGGGPTSSRSARSGNRQYAALDKAPIGSWETARKGALADRDYTDTALKAQRARKLINDYRKSKGLNPLTLDAQLTAAAKAHSRDLARWDRISHYGSDGSNPWDRVKRVNYPARTVAENVGTGQSSVDEVFKGWQNSPSHDKNLLMRDVSQMGIALVHDPKTEFKTFWTLVLGSRR